MVNGEWRDWKWKMFHMFARQINDFETHTYAIPETTFLFSSNLLLKIIQEITLFLWHFFFHFFFFSWGTLFLLFVFDFFFFEQLQQNKMHPHTCLLVHTIHPKHKNTRSHYHCLANKIKRGWDGVGEQKKRLMSV